MKGASEIGDLVENVIICWRNKQQEMKNDGSASEPDAVIKVEAQRNADGWIGKVPMKFDKYSMRFSQWGN